MLTLNDWWLSANCLFQGSWDSIWLDDEEKKLLGLKEMEAILSKNEDSRQLPNISCMSMVLEGWNRLFKFVWNWWHNENTEYIINNTLKWGKNRFLLTYSLRETQRSMAFICVERSRESWKQATLPLWLIRTIFLKHHFLPQKWHNKERSKRERKTKQKRKVRLLLRNQSLLNKTSETMLSKEKRNEFNKSERKYRC